MISHGVPQGTTSVPILFLYTLRATINFKKNEHTFYFAVVTAILSSGDNWNEVLNNIERGLNVTIK